jgi:hypothetical protein
VLGGFRWRAVERRATEETTADAKKSNEPPAAMRSPSDLRARRCAFALSPRNGDGSNREISGLDRDYLHSKLTLTTFAPGSGRHPRRR